MFFLIHAVYSFASLQKDFFPKLMDLFRMCEDLEDIDGLHKIFKLVKGISQCIHLSTIRSSSFSC